MSTPPPADGRDERPAELGRLLDRHEREYPPTLFRMFSRPGKGT